ncbi:glycosyltransferase family 25 protein [Mucilaginibacter xinganensis]|uniref:Glycosyl transferase n=1 Tax=Mucilaginibacter xinganensis TaxID=1234841 RepID=A0A223P3P2_9SPHI|nr:hypothetical protein [Mucilaginibacter xinganensis]ASU36759.1 hypothetical protein MuYL_4876 [Mucilaginibacter xinganensis]
MTTPIPIPTFIINLTSRPDRKKHILNEFAGRDEFAIQVIEPVVHQYPVISLWNTIKHVVLNAIDNKDDYILVCEDDHAFGTQYSAEALRDAIAEANELQADVLSGGISSLKGGLQMSEKLFWMEEFSGTQFIIIFRRFFQKIADADFNESDTADYKIASLTDNKYFSFPFFSTQKSFGYSDVTPRNNTQVQVENLFRDTEINVHILKDVAAFYKLRNEELLHMAPVELPENISIPTYVINLPERTERKTHIIEQFKGRPEFDVTIVEACKHEIGAVGLWQSFRKVVQMAIDSDDDVIIICEDDHCFTADYSRDYLLKNILEAHRQDAEYMSGGTSYFNFAIPVSSNRFWVDTCLATQFVVLYKKTFESVLREPFDDNVVADILLSRIISNKMILSPSVSFQQNFGYSDVSAIHNKNANLVDEMFSKCNTRLAKLKKTMKKRRLGDKNNG